MKRFKVNKLIYMIFPAIVLSVIVVYIFVLYKKSYMWLNIANLGFDLMLLVFYLTIFPYEVSMDREGINFSTIFGKHRIKHTSIKRIRQASFLTGVSCQKIRFYILSTSKGREVLKDIFKNINK